jgi:tetratricopeptide (TPR) repeat protein
MPRKPPPPLNSMALTCLRVIQGWSQMDLSEVSGVPGNLISDYERGRKQLSRERLGILAAAMGLASSTVEGVLDFVDALRHSAGGPGPFDPETQPPDSPASGWGRQTANGVRAMLGAVSQESQVLVARQRAASVWTSLRLFQPDRRRLLVEASAEFHTWGLCERICAESVQAAADNADRALDLARLALFVAERVPGHEAWRSRVQGYAWAHVANARRVRGDLSGAGQAFTRARNLWQAGAASPLGFLDEVQVLSLEASLRIEQLRLQEALALLDQALDSYPVGEMKDRLLLNKAAALEFLGQYEAAITTLLQMNRDLVDPRLKWLRRFTWMANLCHLDRYHEAGDMLPELQRLTARLGNGLDKVRVRWLEGRIAAGQGKRREAIETLSWVRQEFSSQGIAYDTAQANLELSVLYLEEGRTDAVKRLARQMVPIFQAQGVHREALAALKLFQDAAEREALTVDLARRLAAHFQRVRYNPGLRFEE